MKKEFETQASQTKVSIEAARKQAEVERKRKEAEHIERLVKRNKEIETSLYHPKPPAPALKPKGPLRALGDAKGREAEKVYHKAMKAELDRVLRERAEQRAKERQQEQTQKLSKGKGKDL